MRIKIAYNAMKRAYTILTENCLQLENNIERECELLIELINVRKQQLIEFIRKERDYKMKSLKEQVTVCTSKLQQTTGLLQFCIEALKETDPTTFLQIGSSLIHRVSNMDLTWAQEIPSSPWASDEFDLSLDHQSVIHSIESMTFLQMKPPGAPIIIPEECTSENNSITIAWQPHPSSFVEGYILELDDGNNGAFRYPGTVAWFTFDPITAHPEIVLSNENLTVTCDSFEHRVVLGSIGFSRGVHYWEVTIVKYDNNADPAFGIARFDVVKDLMLGKDDKGWSMYIDHQRSWFLHADSHENRTEGGIETGSVIGILLDLEQHQLSFFVNDERQGPIAFTDLHGVFFPAFSVNRNVQITIQTALEPPHGAGLDIGSCKDSLSQLSLSTTLSPTHKLQM
ncbi:E3 ubiquitin-protein ligase TRIM9 like protein [Argiope bruennichi]|uniref:E3 ubiquitin-protein ligase TRIM9 like protein n=1 Tax=Argiope bruennichi TaxID=94029 RepID=A0A8T0FEQ8_ARGBR|nr:E3 ubiquitin-protein ligase TRIM9 like protein [Argiope bruennichi]